MNPPCHGRKGTITRLDTAWSYCYVRFDDDGKEASLLYSLLNSEAGLTPKDLVPSQQLQSFQECVVGKRVSTNDGRKGTITRLDAPWSYCYVRFDDNGKEASLLYSLLNAEGIPAAVPKGLNLAIGVYECIGNGQITEGNMRITGANTYTFGGAGGKYRLEPSGKIVYETGPFKAYFSKLVSGGRIALNDKDEIRYSTSCELNRHLH